MRDWRERGAAWLVRGCVAAVVLATFELLFVALTFPPATSDTLGFLLLVVQVIVVHTFAALPIVALGALALERLAPRLEWQDPVDVIAAALGLGIATWLLHLLNTLSAKGQHRQFPDRLTVIQVAGIVAILLAGVLVFLIARPGLRALSRRLPRLFNPRQILIVAGLVLFFASLGVITLGLTAVHLDVLVGPFGVAVVGLLTLVVRLAWPRVPKRTGRVVLVAWAVLVIGAPIGPWRHAHTRYVLHAHTPVAGAIARGFRDIVDVDGDGASSTWLGGTDCAELDAARGPAVREIAGDGVDQDCSGADAVRATAAPAPPPHWSACRSSRSPLSVLLITIDALRADMLVPRIMPNLSQFATYTTRFTRAYAPATFTDKSMVSIFGAGPLSDLGPANLLSLSSGGLVCIGPPVAERLRSAGFHTAYINPLGASEAVGAGFEQVNPGRSARDPLTTNIGSYLFSTATTNDAIAHLERRRGGQSFLWAHYLDPHAPYREPYYRRFRYGADTPYGRLLAYVDTHVGRLLNALKRHRLASRTMIIITADHGEDLGKYGREGHGPNLSEDTIHVPLLVWVPGCRARTITSPVSLTQIGPTIGQVTGVEIPGRPLPGKNSQDAPVVSEAFFVGGTFPLDSLRRAILWRQYKLVVDVRNGGRLLFDLGRDADESANIHGRREVAEKLERIYQRWLDRPRPPWLSGCRTVSMKAGGF